VNDDLIETTAPCIRGCTWPLVEGEPTRPKPATHGLICEACFLRMQHALRLIPELMANMRAAVTPSQSYELTERVQSSGDGPPAPLRVSALDSSDALFAKLATIIDEVAEKLSVPKPSLRVWMGASEVQGFRPVSVIAAREQVSQLTGWLSNRLEAIAALPFVAAIHDDITMGHIDSPGVYKLTGQYGSEERKPRPSQKRDCPICGKCEVFVAHPSIFNDEPMILCGLCGWLADLEKYKGAAEMFRSTS